jgi:hypothetical protein
MTSTFHQWVKMTYTKISEFTISSGIDGIGRRVQSKNRKIAEKQEEYKIERNSGKQ